MHFESEDPSAVVELLLANSNNVQMDVAPSGLDGRDLVSRGKV